jgi:hypothetical protein
MIVHLRLLSLFDVFPKRHREDRISATELSGGALQHSSPDAAFVGAFLSCLTTSYLSALGLDPAIASALATTLLCGQVLVIQTPGLLPDELFTAIYGGTFGGMTPVLWFSNNVSDPSLLQLSILLTSLAIACGFAFYIVAVIDTRTKRPLAFGYGGRSGAIATVACLIFVALASLAGADDTLFRSARADVFDANPTRAALTFAACLIGTFAVLLPLRGQDLKSATIADRIFLAATIALIGLTGLHLSGLSDAGTLDAFYAGCFLGMSTPERLKGRIEAVLAAVVLTALLVQVRRLLPGVGGSLGLAAFLTVAVFVALSKIVASVAWVSLGRNKNLQKVTQPFAGDRVAAVGVSPGFEPQGSSAVGVVGRHRHAPVIATLASLGIGALVLRALLGPEILVFGMAASTPVARVSASIPEQKVLFQAIPQTVDDAIPLGTPSVELDKVDLRIAQDSLVADQVVDGPAQLKGRADTATPGTSDAAPPPTAQPDLNGVPDGVKDPNDKIFREFLQSRAAHFAAIAEPGRQPLRKKRNHSSRIVGPLASAAAAQAQSQGSRPLRVIPPSRRAPVGSSSRPIYPRSSSL